MHFSQAERASVKEDNPDVKFGEIGKILGARWKELDEEDKKVRFASLSRSSRVSCFSSPGERKAETDVLSPYAQPYEEKAKADKARYEKEKAAYEVRFPPLSPFPHEASLTDFPSALFPTSPFLPSTPIDTTCRTRTPTPSPPRRRRPRRRRRRRPRPPTRRRRPLPRTRSSRLPLRRTTQRSRTKRLAPLCRRTADIASLALLHPSLSPPLPSPPYPPFFAAA